ncbi:hypothetical protein ES708_12101 [subsurface metagenome]
MITSTILHLCILILSGGLCIAETPSGYNAEDVFGRIAALNDVVQSAKGDVTRTVLSAQSPKLTLTGTFALQKPDSGILKFDTGTRCVIGYDRETCRLFYTDRNKGFYKPAREMTPPERFFLSPLLFFGGAETLRNTSDAIEIYNVTDSTIVLRITPKIPIFYNYILIGVNPENWLVNAIEFFDLKNELFYQALYTEYKNNGENIHFPAKITVTTVQKGIVTAETTVLSNVQLNLTLDDDDFRIGSNYSTTWSPEADILHKY